MESDNRGKEYFALIAGGCASAASFFGKLSGDVDGIGPWHPWIIRGTCIGLMLLCNAMVWTFFVKALHSRGGTLKATVTSAASNYFISYFLGIVVFQESVTWLKVIGMVLILLGILLIVKSDDEINAGDVDKNK